MPIDQQSKFADEFFIGKYGNSRLNESREDVYNRVASVLSEDYRNEQEIKRLLYNHKFIPGGRVLASIGSNLNTTPYNCESTPVIRDSLVDGEDSIMDVLKKATKSLKMGAGVGFDFSTLRPKGAELKSAGANSSGSVSFMHLFNASCRTIASAGNRRGAQMAVLSVHHPDIMDFIDAKRDDSQSLECFNISIGASDVFMKNAELDLKLDLHFNGEDYPPLQARQVFNRATENSYYYSEPGFIFLDTMNRLNNLYYCEKIRLTNPCGEIPFPPSNLCLLGSFNLTKYINVETRKFMYDNFRYDIGIAVRMLDNVIDVAKYSHTATEDQQRSKRRIGIGLTGMANAIEYVTNANYGTIDYIAEMTKILVILRDSVYITSTQLAKEKGSFSLFDKRYLESKFVKKLPEHIIALINERGIRNSHLLAIAPQGNASVSVGNVSSGIEPVFSHVVNRKIKFNADVVKEIEFQDYALKEWNYKCTPMRSLNINHHLNTLVVAQRYIDQSISKTVNLHADTTSIEQFRDIYFRAWYNEVKCLSTFTTGAKRTGILSEKNEDGFYEPSCEVNEFGENYCAF